MKNILKIIVIYFVISIIFSSYGFSQSKHIDKPDYKLMNLIPESILNLLKYRPFLLYNFGHRGHRWAIISKSDSVFTAYSGERSYDGISSIIDQSEKFKFDTTSLFKTYKDIIDWGFDSLPDMAKSMKHNHRSDYFPVYSSLRTYTKGYHNLFDSDNAISFSGRDSTTFNNKISELELLMWWLSSPEIRPYLENVIKY